MVSFDFETEGDFEPGATTEWDVFQMLPGDDAPVYLATLYSAYQKTVRVELNGCGAGSFAINRTSPECHESILAQGNLVKVRFPEIHDDYIFAFFLETGDFTLISSQEDGGEMLTFGGRGILSYLEYARAWSESFIDGGQDPIAGLWNAFAAGTGAAPGQILRRLIEEFQDPDRPQFPVPLLTIDFDYDDDSSADAWDETDATDEFKYQVGEDGLAITTRLWETEAITIQMDPDFLLHAWNVDNYGRDLAGDAFGTDIVRFERGVNIATELRRELAVPEVVTDMLVGGEADQYAAARLADAATRVTKEGFIAAFGVTTTALEGIGQAELQDRLHKSDIIMFPIANRRTELDLGNPVTVGSVKAEPGLATAGYYLPGPEGTNGDFWLGDTVRVHTGYGPFDYSEVDARVVAITITREDENAELVVIPELDQPTPVIPTGEYMMSFLIQRSDSDHGADMVPYGTDDGGATFSDPWTWLGGTLIFPQTPLTGYPMDVAYLEAGPVHASWVWGAQAPGLNGTANPTGFHMILSGTTGPPVYLGDYPTTPGYTPSLAWLAPEVTAPADGRMFCLMIGNRAGDAPTGPWGVVGPSGVVTLRQAWAFDNSVENIYPNSILVYKDVTASEVVEFAFDGTTKQYLNAMVVFVPGDIVIDEFTHSGNTGGFLAWSW